MCATFFAGVMPPMAETRQRAKSMSLSAMNGIYSNGCVNNSPTACGVVEVLRNSRYQESCSGGSTSSTKNICRCCKRRQNSAAFMPVRCEWTSWQSFGSMPTLARICSNIFGTQSTYCSSSKPAPVLPPSGRLPFPGGMNPPPP
jgi:hypothetical protein